MSVSPAATVHAARLAAARRALVGASLDALLLTPGADLQYLCGVKVLAQERLTCLVVPVDGSPVLVVPALDAPGAEASLSPGSGVRVVSWDEGGDPCEAIAGCLTGSGPVAVSDRMWAVHASRLRAAMGDREQLMAGSVLSGLRSRKDAAELEALREAAAAIDSVFADIGAWLRCGRTERAVAADVAAAMLHAGHSSADYVMIGSGPNGAHPHHDAADRVVTRGDVVVVDLAGMMSSGYWSDCTRVFVLGRPQTEYAAVHEIVRKAQEAAWAAVRPGVTVGAVDEAARAVIRAAGFGDRFTHRTGHGIGLEVHEAPYIASADDQILREGMVFSLEPGVYLPGRFGVRIEDIVVCGRDGGERLNHRPRGPVVLEA